MTNKPHSREKRVKDVHVKVEKKSLNQNSKANEGAKILKGILGLVKKK